MEEKRIAEALGVREVPVVNEENLLKYRSYLLARLDKETVLTGREDFEWEEKYVFGYGSQEEYERLKKTNPSYKDKYKLIDILEEGTEEDDLIALVERLSDKMRFGIGLSWLTTKDKKCNDFQLLDDFATWVVNWR
ncbi:MAG: hypothetical protein FJ088_08470 [Deltaproteobacteria bacterium]|nr:hypothetical protein [Deltaproteobacteria bacterium]